MSTSGLLDEKSLALLQRLDTLSDDERLEDKKDILKALKDPDTISKFVEDCKKTGQTAVAIDTSFKRVHEGFDEIIKKYSKDFPELKEYSARWDGFKARWDGSHGLLWKSRDFASFTASELDLYANVFLEFVARIETEEDLKDAQGELKKFSEKQHPIDIDPGIADKFKDFKNDIQKFSTDFLEYLKHKKQDFVEEVERLRNLINRLTSEVEVLNDQIKKILIALGCFAALGLFSLFTNSSVLVGFIIARNRKRDEIEAAVRDLAEVNRKQVPKPLQHLQTEIEGFKPGIESICEILSVFCEIWAAARQQAVYIINKLDGGVKVVTSVEFKLELEITKKTCELLQEGLKAYATSIVNPH